MKKYSLFLIGLLVLTSTLQGVPITQAQNGPENPSDIIVECRRQNNLNANDNFEIQYPQKTEDKTYIQVFEEASELYHSYVQCVFDEVRERILASGGADRELVSSARIPALRSLVSPDTACVDTGDYIKLIDETNPKDLLPDLLSKHSNFKDYVATLRDEYIANPPTPASGTGDYADYATEFVETQNRFDNEVQDALVAMDVTLGILREMRLAFVMHVQFQCILKNLQVYRDFLSQIRQAISSYPVLVEGASAVCPNR